MQTSLDGIAQAAQKSRTRRFKSLYSYLNHVTFERAFYKLNRKASVGVDKVSWKMYEENLSENLLQLEERLKQKRYHARFVKRIMIPKDNGTFRPLSIPAIEDKIVQYAVKEILEVLFEPLFYDFSYGYRPAKSAKDAVMLLQKELNEKCTWVVEADIKSYFDTIDHGWLIKMLERRINDKALIILICKWLKAGILTEDNQIEYPEMGTAQGSLVSPVLANIYLHFVLDDWFERDFKHRSEKRKTIIRYADDFVAGFQYHKDAARFLKELKIRFEKFNLTLAEEKTRKLRFNRFRKEESESFDFLGFSFFWSTARSGRDCIMVHTSRKRVRRIARNFKLWCKENRHKRVKWLMPMAKSKLVGIKNYFGIGGNSASLREITYIFKMTLYRWLNRRSERKSYNWKAFSQMIRFYNLEDRKDLKNCGVQLDFLALLL